MAPTVIPGCHVNEEEEGVTVLSDNEVNPSP